ncbi:hypothetical protein N9D63_08155, partial [Opitutales bacterium]|nr:hypothetical protein [Opitutales bacterium]
PTGLPRPNGLAMTALWEYIRKLGRVPPRPVPFPPLSLRGVQRRGNPAGASGNPRIASASHVTHQTGLPRPKRARNDNLGLSAETSSAEQPRCRAGFATMLFDSEICILGVLGEWLFQG